MRGWAGQDLECNGLCKDELNYMKGWALLGRTGAGM